MNFELGKEYIVKVSDEGIVPIEEFDKSRWYDTDHDDLDFLTDREKIVIINQMLDKIRAEIEEKIEEEEFARSVFRNEEKDTAKAEQCTGSIMAYKNMIKLIDKYKGESDIEKRKPCINYEDGCEEWAGCPCVYYKAKSEDNNG